VQIFPNPFSSSATLQPGKNFKDATLVVYNCFGEEVKQIKNINGESMVLRRDNLPEGMYFVRVIENNKIMVTGKLVIMDE